MNAATALKGAVINFQKSHKLASYEEAFAKAIASDATVRKLYNEHHKPAAESQVNADAIEIHKRMNARIAKRTTLENARAARVHELATEHNVSPEVAYARHLSTDVELRAIAMEFAKLDGRIEPDDEDDTTDDEPDESLDVISSMVADECKPHVEKIAKLEADQKRLVGDFAIAHNVDFHVATKRIAEIEKQATAFGTRTRYGELTEQIAVANTEHVAAASAHRQRLEKAGNALMKAMDTIEPDQLDPDDDVPELPPVHQALAKRVTEYQVANGIASHEQAFVKATADDPHTRLLYGLSQTEPGLTDEQIAERVRRHDAAARPQFLGGRL